MKNAFTMLIAGACLVASTLLFAADPAPVAAPASAATSMPMTDGEVRKVDTETHKVTLRHGEIQNLGMPGMTMVFQVQDPAALNGLKAGDKVRFHAERLNGALVVTHIEVAK